MNMCKKMYPISTSNVRSKANEKRNNTAQKQKNYNSPMLDDDTQTNTHTYRVKTEESFFN